MVGFASHVTIIVSEVAGFASPIAGFGSHVPSFGSEVAGFASPIAGFESHVPSFASEVAGFESPIAGFESHIPSLASHVVNLELLEPNFHFLSLQKNLRASMKLFYCHRLRVYKFVSFASINKK